MTATVETITSGNSTILVVTSGNNSSAVIDSSPALANITNAIANVSTSFPAPIDYSSYWDTWGTYWLRLVEATERIADATENIESHQLNIRNDIHHLRILGDHNGSGIRTTTPYGWLTNAYYYKWFITQGHIYESEFDVGAAGVAESIARMNEYMSDMGNNFPGVYSYGGWDSDEQPLSSPPN